MTPKPKAQPEIRTITRLVPPSGNLVQGQSELAINPKLAQAAEELIKASRNHYSPAEGVGELRDAVTKKIAPRVGDVWRRTRDGVEYTVVSVNWNGWVELKNQRTGRLHSAGVPGLLGKYERVVAGRAS